MNKARTKRFWGDRYDGWRVKNVDPFFFLIPQVMRSRLDSQVYFEDEIPLEPIEKFIREHKAEIPGLTTMHIVAAAIVRMMTQKPCTNRFIVHNKLFAHKTMTISIAVKRSLAEDAEETTIKPEFDAMDSLADIVRKIETCVKEATEEKKDSTTDNAAKILGKLPVWLLRFVIHIIFILDNWGILPKALVDLSPWHTSAWLTNVGSIGMQPVFHHLYEFGTSSVFVSMGRKHSSPTLDNAGNIKPQRKLGIKVVVDERICDGYYYSVALRGFSRLMSKPELLLTPPKERKFDPGVPKNRFQ